MSHSLFELSAHYQQIMAAIMMSEEISEETMQQLEQINDSLEGKVLNYTSIIKSLEAKARNINEAVEGMLKRAESLTKSAERLKETVKQEMAKCDKKKIENEFHAITLVQNNPRVEYSNRDLLPKEYWRCKVKEIVEPDTVNIAKLLKEGAQIPGCYLVRDMRVAIR